jgi:hypothetical protein
MKILSNEYRTEYRVDRSQAPTIEVTSWGKRRLRYRVTCLIVVHLENGTDYPVLYGHRVRKSDGSVSWQEVPVSGNYREVITL